MNNVDIMAYYSTEDGKIHNCKEGSMAWWHEKGHLELHKNENYNSLYVVWTPTFFYAGVMFCLLELLYNGRITNPIFVYMALPLGFLMLFDEGFAWAYCFLNIKNWNKNGDKVK
jgi:hypothetical protein